MSHKRGARWAAWRTNPVPRPPSSIHQGELSLHPSTGFFLVFAQALRAAWPLLAAVVCVCVLLPHWFGGSPAFVGLLTCLWWWWVCEKISLCVCVCLCLIWSGAFRVTLHPAIVVWAFFSGCSLWSVLNGVKDTTGFEDGHPHRIISQQN